MKDEFLAKLISMSDNEKNIEKNSAPLGQGENRTSEAVVLDLQDKIGNKATEEYLEINDEEGFDEGIYEADPLSSLTSAISERFFNKGEKLKEYIPAFGTSENGGIPEKFLDISLDTGNVVAGIFEGRSKAVMTVFLKNTVRQTVNSMDMKSVKGPSMNSMRKNARAITNNTAKSAVAFILNVTNGALSSVKSIQKIVESGASKPTGIETLDKVLPFFNVEGEYEKIDQLEEELKRINIMEAESKSGKLSGTPLDEENELKKEEIKARKTVINRKLSELRLIINRKKSKKIEFIYRLKTAWKNLKESEEQLTELNNSVESIIEEEFGEIDKETENEQEADTGTIKNDFPQQDNLM